MTNPVESTNTPRPGSDDRDAEMATQSTSRSSIPPTSSTSSNYDATELSSSPSFFASSNVNIIASPLPPLAPRLKSLIASYATSKIAQSTRVEIAKLTTNSNGAGLNNSLQSYKRAGWWAQFTILSGRSFKNLYRNPMLMLSHYLVSIFVACSFTKLQFSTNGPLTLLCCRHLCIFVQRIDVGCPHLFQACGVLMISFIIEMIFPDSKIAWACSSSFFHSSDSDASHRSVFLPRSDYSSLESERMGTIPQPHTSLPKSSSISSPYALSHHFYWERLFIRPLD